MTVWEEGVNNVLSAALPLTVVVLTVRCCLVWFPGLILASIAVDLTGAAQPALLYLVPSTLLPLLLKATIQVSCHTISIVTFASVLNTRRIFRL